MIVKDYIKRFEAYGFGMFVHFGLYSVHAQGEWHFHNNHVDPAEYEEAARHFCVHPDWAKELVHTAKEAGCRYITLTTRHHDGFSLYDTCGLNTYDACHTPTGRDLVREFVDACRAEDILPFFYHTLLDWHHPDFDRDFPSYLRYLRDSVEILCTKYGEIGGIWFDGKWSKPEADWEEDALYGMIRSHQPNAMIINNTGLGSRGELGHIELDSVTFERGRPVQINLADSPKYIASEMCQILNDHWGYAAYDLNYKPFSELIFDLLASRRHHANFLLNVGPMADGRLRTIDRGFFELFGQFMARNSEAIYGVHPCASTAERETDFLLEKDSDPHIQYYYATGIRPEIPTEDRRFTSSAPVTSITWLDTDCDAAWTQNGSNVSLRILPPTYGQSPAARIAKITLQA